TPAGSGIALKSGASLLRDLGFTGAGGYAVEIDTPEGRMRLLHLQAGSAKLPKGAATQQNRAIQAAGKAGIESLDVNQAESLQKLIDDNAAKERAAVLEQFTLKATEALREQNATMRDNNALQVLRNRLTLEGVSPERISLEEDLLRISQKQNEAYQTYLKLVAQNPAIKGELTNALAAQNEQYAEEARLVRESAAASDNAIANRIGQLRQQRNELTDIQKVAVSMSQTVESSLSAAISSAVTNLVTGAQTIKQTLAEMFSSIAKAFIDMAAQIIAKQLVIIALNTLAKVFGSSGSSGSFTADATPLAGTNWGGGSGGIFGNLGGTDWAQIPSINETIPMPGFANGGIMTSAGPLPLRRYAAGGVANSPQMAVFGERGPEAYVPLLALHPDVHQVIPVAVRRWRRQVWCASTWREIAGFRQRVTAQTYDAVIDTQGLLKSALLGCMASGIRHGFDSASAREPLASLCYQQRHALTRTAHAVSRNRLLAGAALGYVPAQTVSYGLQATAGAA
ncbi:hypothetical protein EBT31_18200, partial [bacterium]|nr:hypothetical protein [bacterium]